MRPPQPKWVQVRVCLEEPSIVFGPRTSVPGFFSGLQETWPPCAQEPFGIGQGRGNGGGGGARCENVGHFKAGKQGVGGAGSLDRKRSAALIEVPPLHCCFLLAALCVCGFFFSSIVASTSKCMAHSLAFPQRCRRTDREASSVWDFRDALFV